MAEKAKRLRSREPGAEGGCSKHVCPQLNKIGAYIRFHQKQNMALHRAETSCVPCGLYSKVVAN